MPELATVGLRAVVDLTGFNSGMGAIRRELAFTNAAIIQFTTRTRASSSAVSQAAKSVLNMGTSIQMVGSEIRKFGNQVLGLGFRFTSLLTFPIVTLGAAITKTGADFEREVTRVVTLVGVAKDQVDGWAREMIEIAGQLGRTPVELARGLFVITSAGLGRTPETARIAMDVLTNSAKAAAVGLGEVNDVARLVTAALQVYEATGLSAAKATDELVMAVREGNFEAEQLATTMGRVLAVSEALEVSFAESLAFVATFTRTGVKPDVATTALRSILGGLLKPTQAAQDALAKYGITIENVRDAIADPSRGFARTLVDLRNRMEDADFTRFIGQIRGAAGALAVTGDLAEEYITIVDNITHANGTTEESFRIVTQTVAFQADALKSAISALAIEWSEALRPTVVDFLEDLNDMVEGIRRVVRANPDMVKMLSSLAAIMATFGPILVLGGLIVGTIGSAITMFGAAITIITAFANSLTILISLLATIGSLAAIAGVGLSLLVLPRLLRDTDEFAIGLDRVRERTGELGKAVPEAVDTFRDLRQELVTGRKEAELFADVAAERLGFAALAEELGGLPASRRLEESLVQITQSGGVLDSFGEAVKERISRIELGAAFDNMGDAITRGIRKISDDADRNFTSFAERARQWGINIINSLGVGMLQAAQFVVNVLTKIANIIAGWLRGASPPKILPDLDKWGAQAAEAWMEGWLLADTSMFQKFFGKVEELVRSLGESFFGDRVAVVQAVIDVREQIARATEDIRNMGFVSEDTWMRINDALRGTSDTLRNYVDALIDFEEASAAAEAAQEALNEAQERFDELLKPINQRLHELDRLREGFQREMRRDELADLLADPFQTDFVKQLAELELEQLGLEEELGLIEDQRDAELELLQARLDAAEAVMEAAEDELRWREQLLDIQIEGNRLMNELVEAIKAAQKEGDALGAGIDDLGAGLGDASQAADELAGKFDTIKTNLLSNFQPILDAWSDLKGAIDEFAVAIEGIAKHSDKLSRLFDSLKALGKAVIMSPSLREFFSSLKNLLLALLGLPENWTFKDFLSGIDLPRDVDGWSKFLNDTTRAVQTGGWGSWFSDTAQGINDVAEAIRFFNVAIEDANAWVPTYTDILDFISGGAFTSSQRWEQVWESKLSAPPGYSADAPTIAKVLGWIAWAIRDLALSIREGDFANIGPLVSPLGTIIVGVIKEIDTEQKRHASAHEQFVTDIQDGLEGISTTYMGTATRVIGDSKRMEEDSLGHVYNMHDETINEFTDLQRTLVGKSIVPDMVKSIVKWFRTLGTDTLNIIKGLIGMGGGKEGAKSDTILSLFGQLGSQILEELVGWVTDVLDWFLALGGDIVTQIAQGIINAAQVLIDALVSVVMAAIGAAVNAAGQFGGSEGKVDDEGKPQPNRFGSSRFRGGLSLVGEAGMELVRIAEGSRIFSTQDTIRMLSQAVTGGYPATYSAPAVSGPVVNFNAPIIIQSPMDMASFEVALDRALARRIR